MKTKAESKRTMNSTVYNRVHRRKDLKCAICPPNKGCNSKRKPKHRK